MSEPRNHPEPERLEAYVEASLDAAGDAAVRAHLAACPRCREEVEELQSLFSLLAELGHFSPGAAFADRVMVGVRIRRPWFAAAAEWLDRLAPKTTRGWAVAIALIALPVLGAGLLAWWLISQPGVTAQGLWLVGSDLAARSVSTGWQWALGRVAESTFAAQALSLLDAATAIGRGGLGLAVVMFATLTAASVWILYQNLFRTEARRSDYASYVF